MNRQRVQRGLCATVLLAATACSSGVPASQATGQPAATAAPAPTSQAASTPAAPVAAPVASPAASPIGVPSPLAAQPGQQPLTVRLVQALPTLSFASFYVARDMGFFDHEGVKFDLTLLQSGATAQQAMVSGTVGMAIGGAQEVAAAVAKNIDLYAIVDVANQTLEVCARQDLLKQKGVTASSPLTARLAALRGTSIGITAPGAASDRTMRWLLQKYGGMDPNTDVQMISVSGASAMAGAMEQNRIQAFLLSPPYCELTAAKGVGTVLIQPSDVPEFKNFVLQVIYSTKGWVEKNPEAARRVATAMAMGDNFLLKYPDASIQILQREFKDVDPQIVDRAVRETILPQIVEDGRMTEALWRNTNTILLESGLVDTPVDTKEGVMWTNQYIGDAALP